MGSILVKGSCGLVKKGEILNEVKCITTGASAGTRS